MTQSSEAKNLHSAEFISLLQEVTVLEYPDFKNRIHPLPEKSVIIGKDIPLSEMFQAMKHNGLNHFVQTNRSDFYHNLFASSLIVNNPSEFIRNPLPFFLRKSKGVGLREVEHRSQCFEFRASPEKTKLLEQVESFAKSNPLTSRLTIQIVLIADELITNAIYNAPTTKDGQALFRDVSRTHAVQFDDQTESAQLFLSHDDQRLFIGCRDPFGSVDRDRMINRLVDLYQDESQVTPHLTDGGAGLGCKLLIDNSIGFYLMVERGKQTLCGCSLPIGIKNKERERLPKNLHFRFF